MLEMFVNLFKVFWAIHLCIPLICFTFIINFDVCKELSFKLGIIDVKITITFPRESLSLFGSCSFLETNLNKTGDGFFENLSINQLTISIFS